MCSFIFCSETNTVLMKATIKFSPNKVNNTCCPGHLKRQFHFSLENCLFPWIRLNFPAQTFLPTLNSRHTPHEQRLWTYYFPLLNTDLTFERIIWMEQLCISPLLKCCSVSSFDTAVKHWYLLWRTVKKKKIMRKTDEVDVPQPANKYVVVF